jgi:hypothetical protein
MTALRLQAIDEYLLFDDAPPTAESTENSLTWTDSVIRASQMGSVFKVLASSVVIGIIAYVLGWEFAALLAAALLYKGIEAHLEGRSTL